MPTVDWFKNGQPLQINGNMKISYRYSKLNALTTSTIVFSPMKIGDDGIYQCFANDTRNPISVSSNTYYSGMTLSIA